MIVDVARAALQEASLDGSPTRLDALLQLASRLGLREAVLREELEKVVEERLAFHMVGQVRPSLNYRERQGLVKRRLEKLFGGAVSDGLLEAVARLQTAIATSRVQSRLGMRSLEAGAANDLLFRQGFRCRVCGAPLRDAIRLPAPQFVDGIEPVHQESLEHQVPYYLVGNATEYEVQCLLCNMLKRDRIGVQEDGFVLCGNVHRPQDRERTRRRMAYWRLHANPACTAPGCMQSSGHSVLLMGPAAGGEELNYDTMSPLCLNHAPSGSYWLHEAEAAVTGRTVHA